MNSLEIRIREALTSREFDDIEVKGNMINLFAIRHMAQAGEGMDITVENGYITVWRIPRPGQGKIHTISKLCVSECSSIDTTDVHTLYIF